MDLVLAWGTERDAGCDDDGGADLRETLGAAVGTLDLEGGTVAGLDALAKGFVADLAATGCFAVLMLAFGGAFPANSVAALIVAVLAAVLAGVLAAAVTTTFAATLAVTLGAGCLILGAF